MTDRATILTSIQALHEMRKEFTARFDRLESELLRLLDTQQEAPLPQSNKPEEWLTAKEVCKALKISESLFYLKIKEGVLPEGVAFSARSKRWRLSDIQAWCEPSKPDHDIQLQIPPKKRGRVSRIVRLEDLRRA